MVCAGRGKGGSQSPIAEYIRNLLEEDYATDQASIKESILTRLEVTRAVRQKGSRSHAVAFNGMRG